MADQQPDESRPQVVGKMCSGARAGAVIVIILVVTANIALLAGAVHDPVQSQPVKQ